MACTGKSAQLADLLRLPVITGNYRQLRQKKYIFAKKIKKNASYSGF